MYNKINNPVLNLPIRDYSGETFISKLLNNLITLVFIVASIVGFFYLISAGVRYILSAGDKAQAEAAKSQITHAIIGLVLVFSVYAIIAVVGKFLGISLTTINFNALKLSN